jgi:hypothetical protein
MKFAVVFCSSKTKCQIRKYVVCVPNYGVRWLARNQFSSGMFALQRHQFPSDARYIHAVGLFGWSFEEHTHSGTRL